MYHITYQFNETAIITVVALDVRVGKDNTSFVSTEGQRHVFESSRLISVIPVRKTPRTRTRNNPSATDLNIASK